MSGLLELRDKLKAFYVQNEIYIKPVLKFILAITVMFTINMKMGYMGTLTHPVVIFALALICGFLPLNVAVAVSCLYLIGNSYALSMEVALVVVVLIIFMYLLYFRFAPKDAHIVLLVTIAFVFKVPYAAPLLVGLMAAPVSVVSMSFGIIIYYFIDFVSNNAGALSSGADTDIVAKINLIVENLLANKMMLLMLIAFIATALVTYLVRRMNIDYVWNTATIVGILTNLLILLIGQFMLNTTESMVQMLLSMIVSGVIVFVMQLFAFSVDYTRTEYVQFEDDEYYYYVKAVPKMTMSASSKKVQRINSRKREE